MLATGFASLATKVRVYCGQRDLSFKKPTGNLNRIFYFASYLTLALFTALSTSGTDYNAYERWFHQSQTMTWTEIFQQEWLYYGFNRLVHYFTSDYRIFIVIFSFVTVGLIYSTLYYLSDYIDFSFAVFVYAAIFYLPIFNTKRICLAAAILFFAVRFLIEKKYIKYLIAIILAMGVHTTAILWLFFLVSYFVVGNKLYKNHKLLVALMYVALATVLIIFRSSWMSIAVSLSDRYVQYNDVFYGIGFGIILRYLFLFYFLIRWGRLVSNTNLEIDNSVWKISMVSTSVSMVFAFLGYVNQILTRMSTYSTYSFVLFLPFLIRLWKDEDISKKFSAEIRISKVLIILYIIIYMLDVMNSNIQTGGLDIYSTIWGWQIGK